MFWNEKERRLRVVWRLAVTGIIAALLTFVLGAPFFAIGGGFPAPYMEKIVLYVAVAIAMVLSTRFRIVVRFPIRAFF